MTLARHSPHEAVSTHLPISSVVRRQRQTPLDPTPPANDHEVAEAARRRRPVCSFPNFMIAEKKARARHALAGSTDVYGDA